MDTFRARADGEGGSDANEAAIDRLDLLTSLLPPEGDFLAIIIDALDGNDHITVGPTVQKSVWIDAGAGDDHVRILSGNAILTDRTEQRARNDSASRASTLEGLAEDALPAVLTALNPAPANGRLGGDVSFQLTLHGGTPVNVILNAFAAGGEPGTVANNSALDLAADLQGALDALGVGTDEVLVGVDGDGRLTFTSVATGATASIEISTTGTDPAVTEAGFSPEQTARGAAPIAQSTAFTGLTIDNPNDIDWYSVQFADAINSGRSCCKAPR